MTASGGLEGFQDGGLEGKCIKTTVSTIYLQEILFFLCVLTILLGHLFYFVHITRAKSPLMSLMCLFKTVPVIISGHFL